MIMLQKYLGILPTSSKAATPTNDNGNHPSRPQSVILTGSTGSLGSYLLDVLAKSPNVETVYCLNRRANAKDLQRQSNAARGLISEWGHKIPFLQSDFSKQLLGLPEANYNHLLATATTIIHNQWQVDFNLSLSSFETHIAGVVKIIELSASSSIRPPIVFTSSIGTVGCWNEKHAGELVPETALEDPSLPEHHGYSESKWIADRLLDAAAKKCGVSSAICRVGQIAGPVEHGMQGFWNPQEWLPSMIESSKYMGMIPDSLGSMNDVRWTPVDLLAKMVVELLLAPSLKEPCTKYYHLENPNIVQWSTLVPVVQTFFASESVFSSSFSCDAVQVVSLEQWITALKRSQNDIDYAENPALKLLDFYEGLNSGNGHTAKLDTAGTSKTSEAMRQLKAVDAEWMQLWLKQWKDFKVRQSHRRLSSVGL